MRSEIHTLMHARQDFYNLTNEFQGNLYVLKQNGRTVHASLHLCCE